MIEKCQDGWFKGSSLTSLKSGVFPGNYVLHVNESQGKFHRITRNFRKNFGFLIASFTGSSSNPTPGKKSPDLIDFGFEDWKNSKSSGGGGKQKPDKAEQIKVAPSSSASPKSSLILYRATLPFPASSQYELELKMGDVIIMNKIREDGWCKGTLQKSGQTGLFPLSFVEKMS